MASLCKPASQAQSHQGLTLEGLVRNPRHQYKRQPHQPKAIGSRSIYWADELAISNSSSNLSPYYTALALGATVVCSAGALIQHTDTDVWPQSEPLTSGKTIVELEPTEVDAAVVTPTITAAQTSASFSPRATNNATACQDGNCQGQAFIEQPSSVQSHALNTAQESLQSTLHTLQTQQAILTHRKDDIAQRQATLATKSQKLSQQFARLTTQLGIHPEDAEQIANLLNLDTTYQVNRLRLNGLKEAIAIEYSQPTVDNAQLETLYNQYAQELEELRNIAQNVLAEYLVEVSAGLSTPIWQDQAYYSMLRELMDIAHLSQMQDIEHNTLAAMSEQLNQRRTELAVLVEKNTLISQLGTT